MHHHTPDVSRELVLLSNVDPERCASDTVVHDELEVQHLDSSSSASDSSMESHSSVSAKLSDAHIEFQAPKLNSFEDAADKDV